MIINENELIEAVQYFYGASIKQAIKWIATYSDKRKEELIKGYREQLKRAFYED